MDDIEDEMPEPVFHPLYDLLCYPRKVGIATLATAIEDQGIHGWDRFGRFRKFTLSDDPEKLLDGALKALAEQQTWDNNCGNCQADEQSPVDRYDPGWDGSGWFGMGWRENDLPDFKAIEAEQAAAPVQPKHAPANIKGENHSMRLIGALLEVIDGTALGEKHPQYESAQQLAGELEVVYKARIGTAGSLVKKFTEARQKLQDRINNL